jgi:hypothetical protein
MLRQSTDPGSAFYAALVTPGSGIVIEYRPTSGASAVMQSSIPTGGTPVYLRVAVAGMTYTAYTSVDGTVWQPIAGSTVTLSFGGGNLLAGLAVSSNNVTTASTATFDTVVIP